MSIIILQATASGIVTGCIYALVALTIVLIYKSTDLINFAGGELVMIGGYAAMVGLVYLGLPYALAIVLTVALTFSIGACFDRVVLVRVNARTSGDMALVAMVIATLGLSYLLRGGARVFSYTEEVRRLPPLLPGPPVLVGPVILQRQDVAIVLIVMLIMIGLWAFFKFTLTGKILRATSQNARAAALVGIPIARIRVMIWGAASALAGLAGLLLGPKLLMTPDMGFILILALAAAIVGGFTSLPGCVVGGILLGVVQNMVGVFVSSQAISVVPFLVIMLVLALRPQGLFGGKVMTRKV
jgi:branched-chain amino acid transport system permease protein